MVYRIHGDIDEIIRLQTLSLPSKRLQKQFLFFRHSVINLSAGTARDGSPGKLPKSLVVQTIVII